MVLTPTTIKETQEFRRLLIYGPPGIGKTTLAGGAPNPVWLDYENSAETFRNSPLEGIPLAGTKEQLAKWDDVLSFVRSKNDYDTYVVDTLSSMYDTFLAEWMATKKGSSDRHIAYQLDFRKIVNVMREIFSAMIRVQKNVILIAHEKYLLDPETNKVLQIRPFLPPSAEQSIERLINEVYYLDGKQGLKGGMTRTLHVSSQGKILAKNRRAFQNPTIENPTWKDI